MSNGETEAEFDRLWNVEKKKDHFTKRSKVLSYFEGNLIPAFRVHASIWVLKAAHVPTPSNGITNNPCESFNAVFHRLKHWKQVPLDVITVSLYHLSSYYRLEISRALHQCGSRLLKEEFDYLQREPAMMPHLPPICHPKDTVDKASTLTTVESNASAESERTEPGSNNSHLGFANDAVINQKVKAVGNGAWVVMETDGVTPRAVRVFPKENCSCPSTKTCYHITAYRLMVGLPLNFSGKVNVSEMHRRKCRAIDKRPPGRKRPRKNEFGGMFLIIMHVSCTSSLILFLEESHSPINKSRKVESAVYTSYKTSPTSSQHIFSHIF